MKVSKKKATTDTTKPLQHYPYENTRHHLRSSPTEPKAEDLIGEIKMENIDNGFAVSGALHYNQQNPQQHAYEHYNYGGNYGPSTPSPPYSQQPLPYTDPSIPYAHRSVYPNVDMPLAGTSEFYRGNGSNRSTISRSMEEEEDEDEEEDEEYVPAPKPKRTRKRRQTTRESSSSTGSTGIKPARRYQAKPQGEKDTIEYKAARARNNDAVRRSRAKAACVQAQKNEKMKLMTEQLERAIDAADEAGGILIRLQAELRSNPPGGNILTNYPALAEVISFMRPNLSQ